MSVDILGPNKYKQLKAKPFESTDALLKHVISIYGNNLSVFETNKSVTGWDFKLAEDESDSFGFGVVIDTKFNREAMRNEFFVKSVIER